MLTSPKFNRHSVLPDPTTLPATLKPDSKDNYRASRLIAIWIEARATKA